MGTWWRGSCNNTRHIHYNMHYSSHIIPVINQLTHVGNVSKGGGLQEVLDVDTYAGTMQCCIPHEEEEELPPFLEAGAVLCRWLRSPQKLRPSQECLRDDERKQEDRAKLLIAIHCTDHKHTPNWPHQSNALDPTGCSLGRGSGRKRASWMDWQRKGGWMELI